MTNAKGKCRNRNRFNRRCNVQKIIQDANAHMQKTFSFIPPQKIKIR
jgi:hypothetical protein